MANPTIRARTEPTPVALSGSRLGSPQFVHVRPEGFRDVEGDRIGWPGRAVAGVLDDRRARAGGRTGPAVRETDGGGELNAVAHGDVVQPLMHRLAGVERRVDGRVLPRRQHCERCGPLPGGGVQPGVVETRGQVPHDQRAERVGSSGIAAHRHRRAVLHERDLVSGIGAGEPGLVDRTVAVQR